MKTQTKVSVAVKEAIGRASKVVSAYGKMQGTVDAIMIEQYPTKRLYMRMEWDAHTAFLRTLRTADGATTKAYIYACDWLRAERGGLRNKAGDGFKDGKHKSGPVPAGVWLRTMGVKLEAAFEYLAKMPKADIEPEFMADITAVCANIEETYKLLETYRAAQALAATDEAETAKIDAAKLKLVKKAA